MALARLTQRKIRHSRRARCDDLMSSAYLRSYLRIVDDPSTVRLACLTAIQPLNRHEIYQRGRTLMQKLMLTAAAIALMGLAGASQSADKKTLAFVVNGASDFWKAAEAGVRKAQGELPNYSLVFKYPEQSSAAIQTRIMDDLVAAGVAAMLVSAVDPKTMGDALNRVGGQVALFTTDSDAPNSKRVAYIGSSNVDAGKQAGQLMVKAMPNGGKCMGFVGLPGADNARERIEGVKETIKGTKIELVD